MNAQPTSPIKFLGIEDNFIMYAIGNNVYQIEVDGSDLEFVFGVEDNTWEDAISGHTYYDESPAVSSLSEVDESDYTLLITSLIRKAKDISDAYEKPINDTEKELMRIVELSTEKAVKDALIKFMIESRVGEGYSFHLIYSS